MGLSRNSSCRETEAPLPSDQDSILEVAGLGGPVGGVAGLGESVQWQLSGFARSRRRPGPVAGVAPCDADVSSGPGSASWVVAQGVQLTFDTLRTQREARPRPRLRRGIARLAVVRRSTWGGDSESL